MIKDIITVGDLREKIKSLPDDMPVYVDDECDVIALLTIKENLLDVCEEGEDEEIVYRIKVLVLGVA